MNCSLAKNLELIATIPSRVSFDTRDEDFTIFNTTTKPLSKVLPRILSIYAGELFNFVLSEGRLQNILGNTTITGVYFEMSLGENSSIDHVRGQLYDSFSSLGYAEAIRYLRYVHLGIRVLLLH